jgi:aspartyl aminopeptidase
MFVSLLVECRFKPRIGFHVVETHIDSPCPISHSSKGNFLHIQVQTYGLGP